MIRVKYKFSSDVTLYVVLLLVLLHLFLIIPGEAARILFIPSIVSPSHKLVILPWADALAERGHDVLMWAPNAKLDKYVTKVAKTDQFLVETTDKTIMEGFVWENSTFEADMVWNFDWSNIVQESTMVYMFFMPLIEEALTNPVHRKRFDSIVKQKWDLIIIDEFFNPLGYMVVMLNKAPMAILCTTTLTHYAMYYAGYPNPPSHIPPMGLVQSRTDEMNIFERIHSTLQYGYTIAVDELMMYLITRILRRHQPGLPNIRQARTNPEFIFVNHLKGLDFARPLPPNVIYVGGIHLKEPGNITQDMLDFIAEGKKGFILVAMGHLVRWENAPKQAKIAFEEGMSRIPADYSVIWQYRGEPPKNLPKHVRTFQWIPQIALLNHPNIRLFLTHCGGNGAIETAYYGVPALAIPFFADQFDNAARFVARKAGKRLRKTTLTADGIHSSIMDILNDNTYALNAKALSSVVRHQPETALERAVFWTEFAVRHKDANYLKSNTSKLSTVQYYMVDVIAVLLILSYICLAILRRLISLFIAIVGKISSSKSKRD